MRDRDPETIGDVIADLCEDEGLNGDQRISTLINKFEEVELDDDDDYDDDDYDDDDDDEYEDAA